MAVYTVSCNAADPDCKHGNPKYCTGPPEIEPVAEPEPELEAPETPKVLPPDEEPAIVISEDDELI